MSVFNGSDHLRESVDSILSQTFSDFEFIIVDDGSTDRTSEILRSCRDNDSRIRVIENDENLGLAASLDKGLLAARGEYIARHDADDIAMPWRFEVQEEFLRRHEEIFLVGGCAVGIDETGRDLGFLGRPLGEKELVRTLVQKGVNRVIHPSMMFRNGCDLLYRERFFYSQDYDFLLRALTRGLRLFNLPQILLKYRISSQTENIDWSISHYRYGRAALSLYGERRRTGRDSYDSYDFDTCRNVEIEKSENPRELREIVDTLFALDAPARDLRRFAYRHFREAGFDASVWSKWLAVFLPAAVRRAARVAKTRASSGLRREAGAPTVALLASLGHGLKTWSDIGTLNRELAVYKRLAKRGWRISFYTYDRTRPLPEPGFPCRIYPGPRFFVPDRLWPAYAFLRVLLDVFSGFKQSVVVTNQAHSGWPAILMGRLWRARVVARCGYVMGERAETLQANDRRSAAIVRREKWTHKHADVSLVPTAELALWCEKSFGLSRHRLRIAPNFVDTDLFKPDAEARKDIDMLCVGRLSSVKRQSLVLEALDGMGDVCATMIGDGVLPGDLKKSAAEKNLRVRFVPRVPNDELPGYYNQAKIFVIASAWEGHPKALLEAMACGCACVGVNVPGIRNQIAHGETGLLASPSSDSVRDAIDRLLRDEALRTELGRNAREYVLANFDIETVRRIYEDTLIELLDE